MAKNKLVIHYRASDSVFYHTKKPVAGKTNPKDWEDSLEDQGYLDFARAPADSFKPDLSLLTSNFTGFSNLVSCIQGFTPQQLRILMFALSQAHDLVDLGLNFGQQVFLNVSAPRQEFANCYAKAFVLMPYEDSREYVYVTGSLDDVHGTLMLVPVESLLDDKQFRSLMSKFAKEGKMTCKEVRRQPPRKMADVPTLSDLVNEVQATDEDDVIVTKRRVTKGKKSKASGKAVGSMKIL